MHFRNMLLFALFALGLPGCGGDSDNNDSDYSGVWDLRYNFSIDECGLVSPDIPGFVEQHTIQLNVDNVSYSLESASGFLSTDSATIQDDGTLLAATDQESDVFGDGTICNLLTNVSYQDLTDNSATSLFSFRISCSGQVLCTSEAVGQAQRQSS